jgi:hypothetical protein
MPSIMAFLLREGVDKLFHGGFALAVNGTNDHKKTGSAQTPKWLGQAGFLFATGTYHGFGLLLKIELEPILIHFQIRYNLALSLIGLILCLEITFFSHDTM